MFAGNTYLLSVVPRRPVSSARVRRAIKKTTHMLKGQAFLLSQEKLFRFQQYVLFVLKSCIFMISGRHFLFIQAFATLNRFAGISKAWLYTCSPPLTAREREPQRKE